MHGGLLARRAGVHVDFHPYRKFGDLRCFPSHFRFSKVTAQRGKATSVTRTTQASHLKTLRPIKEWPWGSVPQIPHERAPEVDFA
jgi:hypothetical protein